jgi:acyl carrier protein
VTKEEKIALIENAIEAENLTADTALGDIDTWDSLARLSILIMLDHKFGRNVEAETLASFVTVGDIMNEMSGGGDE